MKRSKMLIFFGSILLLVALTWQGWNLWVAYQAAEAAHVLLSDLEALRREMDLQSPSEDDTSRGALPAATLGSYALAGTISIPSKNIELPVTADWGYEQLKVAACRYTGNVKDGNLIILAHNYLRFFKSLKEVKAGDTVQFLDIYGDLYQYKVTAREVLHKSELAKLTTGDWDLSLFTCTADGEHRVVLRCKSIAL